MKHEVKTATPERFEAVLRAVESVFGEDIADDDLELFRKTLPVDRLIYVEDGDEVVGGAGAYNFRTTVPGAVLPTAGVTFVGVKPTHTRRGILRALMTEQLADIHRRGEPIATLWASEGAIYGRFGYGLASMQSRLDVARNTVKFLDDPGPSGQTRLIELDGARAEVAPIYDEVQQRTPGMFERSEVWWERRLLADPKEWREGSSQKFLGVWGYEGRARGYVMYRIQTGWAATGPTGAVEVQELIAQDTTALRELWRFVFNIDLVERAKSRYPMLPMDSPLPLMVDEVRRLQCIVGDALWLRVVDIKGALEARSYAADGEIVFEVRDKQCPWNAGAWRLSASGGKGSVEKADASVDISLDASALGSAYLGTFTFTRMMRAERLQVRTEGACARADALFRTTTAPFCPEIF